MIVKCFNCGGKGSDFIMVPDEAPFVTIVALGIEGKDFADQRKFTKFYLCKKCLKLNLDAIVKNFMKEGMGYNKEKISSHFRMEGWAGR